MKTTEELEKEILGLKQTIIEKEGFIKTLRESRAAAINALEIIANSKCNNALLLLDHLIVTAKDTLDGINNQKGEENEKRTRNAKN